MEIRVRFVDPNPFSTLFGSHVPTVLNLHKQGLLTLPSEYVDVVIDPAHPPKPSILDTRLKIIVDPSTLRVRLLLDPEKPFVQKDGRLFLVGKLVWSNTFWRMPPADQVHPEDVLDFDAQLTSSSRQFGRLTVVDNQILVPSKAA